MSTNAAKPLEADRERCGRCGCITCWEPIRGRLRLRCVGCGDVFPCEHDCAHLDCQEVRQLPKKKPRSLDSV